jgi:hypothetical protein
MCLDKAACDLKFQICIEKMDVLVARPKYMT